MTPKPQANTLHEILDEYENGQNPHQSEEYRLDKANKALNAYYLAEVLDVLDDQPMIINEKWGVTLSRKAFISAVKERFK